MKLPSQEETSLPIGKIMLGVTAIFGLIIGGVSFMAAQANDKKADSYYISAQDHLRLEEQSDALAAIDHALELKEKPEYLDVKASILINQNKVYEADKILQKLISYRPKDAHYRDLLSTMALNEDHLDQSIKWMKEAQSLEPDNPAYTIGVANLLFRDNKLDEAKGLYEKVIQKDPNYRFAWEQYANALSNSGRYQEALALDEKAIQQFPKDFNPYFQMASTYDSMGEKQKAVVAYRKSLELYPIENSIAAKRIFEITGHHVPASLEKMVTDNIAYTPQGNVMYVQASVNEKTGRFLVDTGASVCVLYQHAAAKYHLTPTSSKIAVQTANGVIQVPLAYGNVQVGGSRLAKVVFGIAPDPKLSNSDGIIGMDFLNQFQMTVNKDNHTITLAHAP